MTATTTQAALPVTVLGCPACGSPQLAVLRHVETAQPVTLRRDTAGRLDATGRRFGHAIGRSGSSADGVLCEDCGWAVRLPNLRTGWSCSR